MSNPPISGDIIAQFIGRYRREFDFFVFSSRQDVSSPNRWVRS